MMNNFLFPKLKNVDIPNEKLEDIGSFLPQDILAQYIEERKKRIREDPLWVLGNQHFVNEDGSSWEMSPGELALFRAVLLREYPRVQVVSSTQYGKTITVARALLERITTYPEEWLLIVPDTKRGKILLNYMIKDTYGQEHFRSSLADINLSQRDVLNRLLEEKSKVKLTYQVIGENDQIEYGSIEIITCEARRKQDVINTIMGFGGRHLIQEEASLEDDEIDAGIFRMLAGRGEDTFLLKIGNPFYRNHFLDSWKNPNYKKIFIDYRIGLLEGRYTKGFIEEAKTKRKFDVLFECKFPAEDQIVEGWSPLITESELENAFTDDFNPFGAVSLGADPADSGENESAIVSRWRNVAKISYANNKISLIDFCGKIGEVIDQDKIDVRAGAVDKVGVGAMIPDEMKKAGKPIQGVNVGEKCDTLEDQKQFANKKSQYAWMVRDWIKGGGKLLRDNRWYQLLNIRYKEDNKRRMVLMPKAEMLKRGIASPDVFDALCLTFARPQIFYTKSLEDDFFERKMRQKRLKKRGDNQFKMTSY